jgi:mono/diheme cytochrome c family protein
MKPLRMAYLAAFVAGVGFFVMSVAWLGVWPARVLEEQAREFGPSAMMSLTASELRGREIYAREGCGYCHTQQIRFTAADEARFGAPTLAWEGRRDYPHMLGTRRIGPDLSRTGGTRSEDWLLAHLYDPRLVVAESVMPAYRHLFDGAVTAPRQEARDLVAYLETLGRARELAEGGANASLNANPARARRTGDVPALPPDGDSMLGEQLYGRYCVTCHGATGLGEGPAAIALIPKPANLRAHWYSNTRLAEALWHGVPGTSMPAWRDLSLKDLAALVAFIPRVGLAANAMKHDRIGPTDDQRVLGARVYADNCAQCHGTRGAGDGWAAHQLTVPPTNFRQQKSANAVQTIRDGVEGTMMASWSSRLSEDEMMAVALYVGEFFREQMADDARARRNR